MTMTLAQFRATRKIEVKDATWCDNVGLNLAEQKVAEYVGPDGLHIYVNGDNDYLLVIENMQYDADNLEELEEILYEWWTPVPD